MYISCIFYINLFNFFFITLYYILAQKQYIILFLCKLFNWPPKKWNAMYILEYKVYRYGIFFFHLSGFGTSNKKSWLASANQLILRSIGTSKYKKMSLSKNWSNSNLLQGYWSQIWTISYCLRAIAPPPKKIHKINENFPGNIW